jgi:hypothetical protein
VNPMRTCKVTFKRTVLRTGLITKKPLLSLKNVDTYEWFSTPFIHSMIRLKIRCSPNRGPGAWIQWELETWLAL